MIIFSDFDGTLFFRHDEEKTNRNVEALKRWRAAGNQFCVITGRGYASVMRQMPEIADLCDYYILNNGSVVLDGNGNLLTSFPFEPEIVSKLEQYAETLAEKPVLFYFTPNYEGFEPTRDGTTMVRFWFKDASLCAGVAKQITELFGTPAFVQANAVSDRKELVGRTGFVEIISSNSDKSAAIHSLEESGHISRSDIITVGDGLNDRLMVVDYDGFAIEGSELSAMAPELRTTSSIASIVDETNR
ncbi:HAD family phosphatase [Candidatus Saccharibacteria bacterium]|nr:HAD family phosphatase [Candidatus Saccharibacteria bacterium]